MVVWNEQGKYKRNIIYYLFMKILFVIYLSHIKYREITWIFILWDISYFISARLLNFAKDYVFICRKNMF